MGMFDYLRCEYPLDFLGPITGGLEFSSTLQSKIYQTKSTPAQMLDNYVIRADGSLWYENYDVEDKSEIGEWMAAHPNAGPDELPQELRDKGWTAYAGCITRINPRWEQVTDFTGEIEFHDTWSDTPPIGWVSFSTYFVNGQLKEIHLKEFRKE